MQLHFDLKRRFKKSKMRKSRAKENIKCIHTNQHNCSYSSLISITFNRHDDSGCSPEDYPQSTNNEDVIDSFRYRIKTTFIYCRIYSRAFQDTLFSKLKVGHTGMLKGSSPKMTKRKMIFKQ